MIKSFRAPLVCCYTSTIVLIVTLVFYNWLFRPKQTQCFSQNSLSENVKIGNIIPLMTQENDCIHFIVRGHCDSISNILFWEKFSENNSSYIEIINNQNFEKQCEIFSDKHNILIRNIVIENFNHCKLYDITNQAIINSKCQYVVATNLDNVYDRKIFELPKQGHNIITYNFLSRWCVVLDCYDFIFKGVKFNIAKPHLRLRKIDLGAAMMNRKFILENNLLFDTSHHCDEADGYLYEKIGYRENLTHAHHNKLLYSHAYNDQHKKYFDLIID
jgi:hypothetical protein